MSVFKLLGTAAYTNVVVNSPKIFGNIVVSAQCKHYFRLISNKNQNAYQLLVKTPPIHQYFFSMMITITGTPGLPIYLRR